MDRVTGMQVFAKAAGLGSLSAAARAMGISQTMATKHVTGLEERLGVKLLHRTTRRLTLTETGRSYLESVERILDDIEDADATASLETRQVRGKLRLNAPLSYAVRRLAPLIPELTRRHPELQVDLGLNDRYVDLVEEGWDLAIRIGNLKSSALIARRLAPCPTIVCASPDYLKRRGKPRKVADLADHDCLSYTLSRSIGAGRWSFGAGGKVKVAVSGSLQANNGDALVLAAVAGQGIVYQPHFLVEREIAEGSLVPLRLDHATLEIGGIFAVYPAARRPPAKVRATIDFLAERLAV